MDGKATYQMVWRWHFYAGLFVLPFVLILAISGSIYLFKPQIDRWEEQKFLGLSTVGSVSADDQVTAALAANEGSRFISYRLPREMNDAAAVLLSRPDNAWVEVFVSPRGQVLGALDPETRITTILARFHGSLLLGKWGERLVELAASWAFVMVLSGLYLWWPRPFRVAGTLWPRRSLTGRPFLKDLHRVTGFWIAGFVLAMLASGLPWTGTWGAAFNWARTELGLIDGPAQWEIGAGEVENPHENHGESSTHHSRIESSTQPMGHDADHKAGIPLARFVALARQENLPFPTKVIPPNTPQPDGIAGGDEWTIKSDAQNRPLNRSLTYDPVSGQKTKQIDLGDIHPIDQAVAYTTAWHEGQLFGLPNQIIGLLTAIALMALSVVGALMWWMRRPSGQLGAPMAASNHPAPLLIKATVVCMAFLLPLFGLSVIFVLIADRLIAGRLYAP